MMKDFRFIKTGNSYSRGQKIGKDGNSEYVINDVLADGTIMVSRHPDGRTFTFSSEQELKDWLRNSHIGNESIDKQEWSMFKGLKKDAEKEVGNYSVEEYAQKLEKDAGRKLSHEELAEDLKKGGWSKEEAKQVVLREVVDRVYGKVGNSTGDEYNAEIQRLTKKAEQLRRMGQGRSAMEIEKQIEKLGKELRELGNSKTGNETPEEMEVKYKGYTITYFPYQKKYMVRHPNEVSGLVQKHFTSVDEAKKAIDKKSVGNETKGERKFGKVMGEFEEGALKTPQGKTVTDPAQAKAIAYSEADKVDNLKRARNAMVKNQQITLWKGNDSVLISEDGLVQYLERNQFETDRDKYDTQEKAVEELTKKGYRKK